MTWALAIPLTASALAQSAPPTLPNIGYLGSGYDIFKGNPHSTGQSDPGFKGKVLELSYDDGATTVDQQYVIPDKTDARGAVLCNSGFEASKIYGAQSFYHSLSVEAETDFGAFGASFSASTSYKSVTSDTSSHNRMYSEVKATCSVYKVRTQSYDPPKATDDFTRGVQSLPESFDDGSAQEFYDFIDNFGTHVMTAVEMGGRYGHRLEFTQESWTHMHETGTDVDVAARYAGIVSAGASCDTSEQTRTGQEFTQSSFSESIYNLGGQYSKSVADWTQTVKEDPMPIKYTLHRLDEVLTTSYMPGLNGSILTSRKDGLKAAVDNYCEKLHADNLLSSCDVPPADQPMEMRTNLDWSNHNRDGRSNGVKQCPHFQHVTGIQWKEQSGYGLIDLRVTCSDGSSFTYTSNSHGGWNRALNCDGGFSKVQGQEQSGYGLVNFRTYCLHDTIEQDSNGNYDGNWNTEYTCPEWAPVVVGFETDEQSGYGFVNFRARCSNGVTTTIGGALGHVVI